MRKPSPQVVKAQKYLDKNPVTSTKALQNKFNISYQIAYNLTKGRQRKEAEQDVSRSSINKQPAEFKTQEPNIIQGYTGKQYQAIDFTPPDMVNSPPHYTTGGIEVIDFIEAKGFNYRLGNAIKYISRASNKGHYLQDLEKAQWYLTREIEKVKNESGR